MVTSLTSTTLRRVFDASPISLTLASPVFEDTPLVMVNHAFEQLTGYPSADALGRNCRFLQGSNTEPAAREALRNAVLAGRECCVPITNYRRDGSRFRNLVFVFPLFDANGALVYLMGSQYDITTPARRIMSHGEYTEILDETLSLASPALAEHADVRIVRGQLLTAQVGAALGD